MLPGTAAQLRSLCLFALLVFVLANQSNSIALAQTGNAEKRLLFISAYHPSYPTFYQQIDGVKSVLDTHKIEIAVEFMDSKRFPGDANVDRFLNDLTFKLSQSSPYDLLIVADDNALKFAITHQDGLFRNLPIVFLGINNIELALAQDENPQVTGVVESVSMFETLQVMGQLLPQSSRFIALVDSTTSGQADLKQFYMQSVFFPQHEFVDINLTKLGLEGYVEAIGKLGDKDAVLLLSLYKVSEDKVMSFDEALALIQQNISRPVFHLWEHGLGEGIIGGKLISHAEQGRVAAKIALSILKGKAVASIPVKQASPNKFIFDNEVLSYYRLSSSLLPQGAQLLNQKRSYYEENRQLIWISFSIIAVLLILLIWALTNLIKRKESERNLRYSEMLLKKSQAIAHVGTWQIEVPSYKIYWSEETFQIYGRDPKQFKPTIESTRPLIHEEDLAVIDAAFEKSLKENVPIELTHRLTRPNGEVRTVIARAETLLDDNKRVVKFIGMIHDVTQLKQVEEALISSEARQRKIFNEATNGILLTESATNTISDCNMALAALVEHSVEDLIGQPQNILFQPSNGKAEAPNYADVVDSSEKTGLIRRQIVCKSGQRIHVEIKTSEIELEGKSYQLAIFHDISERILYEAERERLVAAISQSAEAIYITDQRHYIQYVNPAFEKITGYSWEESVGNKPKILDSNKHEKGFYKKIWHALAEGKSWQGRIVNRRKNGAFFTADTTFSPILDDQQKIVNYVVVKRDISKEVHLEKRLKQAHKMEAVGTLAGGIAHDLNGMLTPLIGYSELLKAKLNDRNPEMEYLNAIFSVSIRMRDLVKQILAFSRYQDPEKTVLRPDKILQEAIHLLRSIIPTTIEFKCDIASDCGVIEADSNGLHQVVMNLTSNAFHAMRESGGTLQITMKPFLLGEGNPSFPNLPPGKYLYLSVEDNGSGIKKEHLDKIFDPYFSTKSASSGTGLGMSVVHGIVKRYRGEIHINSEYGKGTCVELLLPQCDLEIQEKTAESVLPLGTVNGEKILLVDDEVLIVEVMNNWLKRLGYEVVSCHGSEEALVAFEKDPDNFDLLVSDMTMPQMTGLQLAEKIKVIRPNLPVVICSGFSDKINENNWREKGVDGFVVKPFLKNDFARIVRQALDRGHPASEMRDSNKLKKA